MATLDIAAVGAPAWNAPATGTSPTPTYPTGILAGDYLLLLIVSKQTTAAGTTIATPSGWTLVGQAMVGATAVAPGNGTGSVRAAIFSKVAVGGETGTLAVTVANGDATLAAIQAWRATGTGVTWTSGYGGAYGSSGSSTSATFNFNVPTVDKAKIIVVGAIADDTAVPLTYGSVTQPAAPASVSTSVTKLPTTDLGTTVGNDASAGAGYLTVLTADVNIVGTSVSVTLATAETAGNLAAWISADGTPPAAASTPVRRMNKWR